MQNESSPTRIQTRSQLLFVAWRQAEEMAAEAERGLAGPDVQPAPEGVVTRARTLREHASDLLGEMLGELQRQVADPRLQHHF